MKSSAEFDQYYQLTLVPLLESLEPERKKLVSTFWIAVLSLLLFIPVIFLVVAFKSPWLLLTGILPLILTIKKFSDHSKIRREYVRKFKETVIAGMVKFFSDQLIYDAPSQITQTEYLEGDLFRQRMDRFSGGDLVNGTIGSTIVRFSELFHQEKRESVDSKGHRRTYWVTIFKGIFFIADFNKHFNGRTYVLPEAGFDLLGVGKLVDKWFGGRGEAVLLENPVFEKYFKVFASDQIEARYILSSSLMERLTQFREKVSNKIYVSFINSRVFIAVPVNKNLFEPNEFSSGMRSGYLKEYFYYLDLVTGIVEDLNLNTRIWTKQ